MNPNNPNLRTTDEWSEVCDMLAQENKKLRALVQELDSAIQKMIGILDAGYDCHSGEGLDPDEALTLARAALEPKKMKGEPNGKKESI